MKSLCLFWAIVLIISSVPCPACLMVNPEIDVQITDATGTDFGPYDEICVGQTISFDADETVCADSGTLQFTWVFPSEAYNIRIYGTRGEYAQCKFSPSGSYDVNLKVKNLSTGIEGQWQIEADRSLTCDDDTIFINRCSVTWYVSLDGSDDHAGYDADGTDHWSHAFRSIQMAIDTASDGDEIIVRCGTTSSPAVYYERLDMKDKSLYIHSEDPDYYLSEMELAQATIIDAQKQGAAVLYNGTRCSEGELEGFTIRGGFPAGDGLALHLDFDDQSELSQDVSGKDRDGINHGSVWTSGGYDGGAADFDGIDDYIEIEDYNGVLGRGVRTCSAWIKTSSTGGGDIMGWGNDLDTGSKWRFCMTSGYLRIQVANGNLNTTYMSLNNNNWHHVAVVWPETDSMPAIEDLRLYVDGVLVTNTTATNPENLIKTGSDNTVLIGAYSYNGSPPNYFDGSIDDVRIYSRALSEAEIAEQADIRLPAAHWRMDGNALDSSKNNLDGTVTGGSVWTTGYHDQAFSASMSKFITVSDDSKLDFNAGDNFTVTSWFKRSVNPGEDVILQKSGGAYGGDYGYALTYEDTYFTGIVGFNIFGYGFNLTASYEGDYGGYNADWHHVAGVCDTDSQQIRLYIDGILKRTTSGSMSSVNNPGDLLIASDDGVTNSFVGKLDDIRVYRRALSYDEIKALANGFMLDSAGALVAHWTMDDDRSGSSVIADSSGNSYDGVSQNDAVFTFGLSGAAIELNGFNQYISLPSGIINPAEDFFSAFAWVRLDDKNEDTLQVILQQCDVDTDPGRCLLYRGVDDKLCSYLGGSLTESTDIVFASTEEWHCVGLTYDGQTVRLYADGQLCGSANKTAQSCEGPLLLGRHKTSETNYWAGLIDDVKIYDYALSESEVARLYDTGSGVLGRGVSVAISNCIITDNVSSLNGGGIFNVNGSITNTIVSDNSSYANGGGLADCHGIIKNCTIVNNHANDIGGIMNCGGELTNLIVWGNTSDLSFAQTENVVLPTYCCVQDWLPDAYGNMNYAPYFSDPNYHLSIYSPCVDAGDDSDYANEPSPNGNRINMGAYGNTDYAASRSTDTDNEGAGDGMPDAWETEMLGGDVDPDDDDDGDRVSNLDEYYAGTDPDDDSSFTIPLWWYVEYGIDAGVENVMNLDPDGDGVTNFEEFAFKINPLIDDSDGDGIPDPNEIYFADYINIDPSVYDAHTESVGGVPAIWWYTWWSYCHKSKNAAIYTMRDNFIPSASNAEVDCDNDGLDSTDEYTEQTDPTQSNHDDSWSEYVYDDAGGISNEKQMVYDTVGADIEAVNISETVYDYDQQGRLWRTRQRFTPGSDNNSKDAITLIEYYVDGTVERTIRKGYASNGTANQDDDAYQTGDVVVSYTYNPLGRQETVIDALGYETVYYYEADTGLLDYVNLPAKAGVTRTLTYIYDNVGRMVATIRPDDSYEVVEYDSLGNVIKSMLYETVDAIDNPLTTINDKPISQYRMEYDNLGMMVKNVTMYNAASTDPNDPATDRVTYNEVLYSDPNKTVNSIVYGDVGEIVDSTWSVSDVTADATGRGLPTLIRRGFACDDSDQPLVEQDFIYNAVGQVIQKATYQFTDRDAETASVVTYSRMEYDDYGRLVANIADPNTDPNDNILNELRTEYIYSGNRQVAVIDPNGFVTRVEYDSFDRMKKKTENADGLSRVTEYEYDRLGNLVKIISDDDNNPVNGVQETLYAYDAAGNGTQVTYPDLETISYVYDDPAAENNRPTARTDQRGMTLYYEYDKVGMLVKKKNHATAPTVVETYTYDARGLMLTAKKGTAVDDDIISAATFTYNGLGYLEQTTQSIQGGAARTIQYTRNQNGRPTRIVYPDTAGTEIGYSYTSLGQVSEISRNPSGSNTKLADYDYYGSLVAQRVYSNLLFGGTFTAMYDEFGRIRTHKTVNLASEGVDFDYTYDKNSNILTKKYSHRTATTPSNVYGYDKLNRLTNADYLVGDSSGWDEAFDYDLLGNRKSRQKNGQIVTQYEHDETNAYTSIYEPMAHWTLDEGTGETAYDAVGTNDGSIIDDISGNAQWSTGIIGSSGLQFVGSYGSGSTDGDYIQVQDVADLLPGTDYTVSWWAKPDNPRLEEMILLGTAYNANDFEFYQKNTNGDLTVRLNDSSIDRITASGALQADTWSHYTLVGDSSGTYAYVDGVLVGSTSYIKGYAAGRDLFIGAYPNRSWGFNGEMDEVMIFDEALTARQVKKLYQSTGSDYGKFEVTHDAAGNLTSDHRGYSYGYDNESRLVLVYEDDDASGDYSAGDTDIAMFTYDALGRRIEMVDAVAGSTMRYYYDDQRVLLETDATGTEADVRYFVYGNYIDEVLLMTDVDSTNAVTDGDYYYGHDHLYSVTVLFDDDGNVVERYEYDAYGTVRVMDASYGSRTASVYGNSYLYTGRRLDTFDGGSLTLYCYRARIYDAQTGRFMQRDPLEYQESMNLYEYVDSMPTMMVDPYGLCKVGRSWAITYPLSYSLGGGDVAIPGLPGLYIGGGLSVKGKVSLKHKCVCCRDGGTAKTTDFSLNVKFDGNVRLTWGIVWSHPKKGTDVAGLKFSFWGGLRGIGRMNGGVSGTGSFNGCDKESNSIKICGGATFSLEVRGGFEGKASYKKLKFFRISGYAYAKASMPIKGCFRCNADGCSFLGVEKAGAPSVEIGASFCYGFLCWEGVLYKKEFPYGRSI